MPIGQRMRSISSPPWPAAARRLRNLAHFEAEPMRPAERNGTASSRLQMSRSIACEWVMITCSPSGGANATASAGFAECSSLTLPGTSAGNLSGDMSTQTIPNRSVGPSTDTTARPTWPAP